MLVIDVDPRRVFRSVEPCRCERGAVEEPRVPRAVLQPHRALGDELVEDMAVEITRDRFVVADTSEPLTPTRGTVSTPEYGGKCLAIVHARRAAADGTAGGSQRQQVDVVVVEAWEQHRRRRRQRSRRRDHGRPRRSPRSGRRR